MANTPTTREQMAAQVLAAVQAERERNTAPDAGAENAAATDAATAPDTTATDGGQNTGAPGGADLQHTTAETVAGITPAAVLRFSNFGEKGAGLLHAAMFKNKLIYTPETKEWFTYTGHHWELTNIHHVKASVSRVSDKFHETAAYFEQLAVQATDSGDTDGAKKERKKAERLEKAAFSLNKCSTVNACIEFSLANDDPLLGKPDWWDVDPWLLGVANGVVDLRTGEHRPGRPTDYITRYSPVEWAGLNAPCPLWEKFLAEAVGAHDGVIEYLHKAFGYAITGLSKEPLFLVLYGEQGRNGKSLMMEILKKLLGPYMGAVKPEMLLDRNVPKDPDSASPSIIQLKGQRIVWASESNENQRFSTAQVKRLSGNDTLTGRYLWDRKDTDFTPTHTLFLMTNFKPSAPPHDLAFWERVRLVDFPFRFVDQPKAPNEKKRDKDLGEKIINNELPGVLAWLVRGCLQYQRDGLIPPAAISEATREYQVEEDTMQIFVDQCLERFEYDEALEPPDTIRIGATELYEVYQVWHRKYISPRTVPSMNVWGRRISRKLERRKVGGHTYYYGVRLSDAGIALQPTE